MDSPLLNAWPEPVVPVQSLSASNLAAIPLRYVKPPADRPSLKPAGSHLDIPTIDISGLRAGGNSEKFRSTVKAVSRACEEWGLFRAVNHGVSPGVVSRVMQAWREFFRLPLEEKLKHANSPRTYEGYGSRLGVVKGAPLDWGDYYFLLLHPLSTRDYSKWPSLPSSCRDAIDEYGTGVMKVCGEVMRGLSLGLGLRGGELEAAVGGEEAGATMRANYYPRCPQPELTLGLSAHSDNGALTVVLADDGVRGLEVRYNGEWVSVPAVRNSFIVHVGDQIQILSNGRYKSAEHRAVVNSDRERMSIALFYNPSGDIPIKPLPALTLKKPPLYPQMTFNQYRLFIRNKGLHGKSQVDSMKAA